tara:strand:+ start:15100 stop:17910 length:2811 start_codon:yes stop_codon:yes gene_type:complete
MKIPRLLAPLFLVFTAQAQEAPTWVHEASDIKPDENVTWGQLENGLRYAILPNEEPPDRISLRLYVDAGSMMEEDDQQGLAHFLEHMAFNGTKNFPAGEMVEYFQRLGMAFGSHTNAHTSFKETVYKLELPESSEKILDDGFKLLRDYADGLLFGEKEIEKERGVILSEKRSRDSANWRSFVDWVEFALPENKISERLPIGTEEVISNAPRQRFVDFYNQWYTPERMAVVVVGDINPDEIETYIVETFQDFKSETAAPDPDFGSVAERGVLSHHHSDKEATETQVSIETMQPMQLGADSNERRAIELRSRLADMIMGRRLEIVAKQEGSPLISGFHNRRDLFDLNLVDYASIDATTKPENWDEGLAVIEQELRRALKFGFTEAEMDEAKAKLQNALENQAKSAATRKSRDLADRIVERIGSERVFTHPDDDLARVTPLLASITSKEIWETFRTIWGDLSNVVVYASGNLEIEGGKDAVLAAFTESQQIAVEPPAEEDLGEFAYAQDREPGEIADRSVAEDLEITQITFANNVRANFKVTDFEDDTVGITARIGGGLLTMPLDKPGLSSMVAYAFGAGGLKAHSADDLQRLLAGKSVGAGLSASEDAFTLSGQTTPEDLLLQLQLMRAYVTDAGYREEGDRQFQKALDQLYQQLKHDPNGVMADEVAAFLHGNDPRFGYPERDEMAKRNSAEAKSWVQPQLDSAYLEISVVGDFDLDTAIDAVARTFGTLPEREAAKPDYAAERKVAFPADVDSKKFEFESTIPKSMVLVYWPTADMSDIQRTRRLGLLSSIFRDRLRKKVREELGDAYSPYARNSSSETYTDYGYLFALVEAAPDQAEKLSVVIKQLGTDLAAGGTDQDELDRSKLPLLTQIAEYRRTNNYWLSMVLAMSQEQPDRLDWARSFVDDYESISVEEINALAKDYLDSESSLEVLIMPK